MRGGTFGVGPLVRRAEELGALCTWRGQIERFSV